MPLGSLALLVHLANDALANRIDKNREHLSKVACSKIIVSLYSVKIVGGIADIV